MSRFSKRIARRRRGDDSGFTLVEIMAALLILALGSAAVVPVLIIGSKAGHASKLNTQAKNLTQERMERMRDLQFHVEKQNGNFVDLLDLYYTNRSASPTTTVYGTETRTGGWVGSGTVLAGEPVVPFYRVTINAIDGYPRFKQTVTTQFLQVSGAAVPAAQFPTYDSQSEALDGPPSLLVGVTVLTSWTQGASTKSYRAYTRIADSRGSVSTLTSQGKATFLKVSSAALLDRALSAKVGVASADGSQSTGSTATASGNAGTASDPLDLVSPQVEAANGVKTSPVTTNVNAVNPTAQIKAGDGQCGWAAFGESQVTNLSASITNGVPQVPSTVTTAVPQPNQVTSGLYAAGGNNQCGLFAFNNHKVASQAPDYNPLLFLDNNDPLVFVSNAPGNSRLASGSGWVDATSLVANPHTVTSGAGASSSRQIEVFPSLWLVNGGSSRGLVNITLNSSSIRCMASVTVGSPPVQTVTAAYNVTIEYWTANGSTTGGGAFTTVNSVWNGTTSADPLASIPLNTVIYQNGAVVYRLSDFISSWGLTRSVTPGSTNGVYSVDNVFSLTTVPVRLLSNGTLDPSSSVGVDVGHLSCAAADNR